MTQLRGFGGPRRLGPPYSNLVTFLDGTVYGTDIYRTGCSLASAAVHAGVVAPGEKAVVRVTIMPQHPEFAGTTRNGVTSQAWSSS